MYLWIKYHLMIVIPSRYQGIQRHAERNGQAAQAFKRRLLSVMFPMLHSDFSGAAFIAARLPKLTLCKPC